MNSTRHGLRANCIEKCVVVINGSKHECTLENISISGALIHVSTYELEIHPGSRCGLHLCSDPNICPGEYACQITRIGRNEIGLKFVTMH